MESTEKIVSEFFIEREGPEILDEIKEVDLVEEGILDSLDFFTLAVYIEEKTGVKLDMTSEETFKNLRSWTKLIKMIDSRIE